MADTTANVTGASGTTLPVDGFTQANGDIRQAMVVGDAVAATTAGVRADGFLNARMDPTTLLFDTFETIDTTNTWTLSTQNPPVAGTAGTVVTNSGTAANAFSYARSQPSFVPGSNAFLQIGMVMQLASGTPTGATLWWGLGIPTASPTTTTPITNGTIFEVDAVTGALWGRVYSAGAKTQELALTRPTDGAVHRYQILYKATRVYFNIDNVDVGSLPFPNPAIAALPLSFGAVNGATVLGANPTLSTSLMGLADTAQNEIRISDGTYPWRRTQVRATGAMDVNISSSASTIVSTATPANGQFAAATINSAVTWAVPSAGNVTLSMSGGSYALMPIIFEASTDGTNWFTVDGTQLDGTGVNTQIALANSAIRAWNFPVPGYTQLRVRLYAAATITTQPTWVLNQGAFLWDPSPVSPPIDGQKATYTATISGLATNTAIDLAALIGSATRTVRCTRVDVELLVTTASTALNADLRLVKRSTAGTPAAPAGTTVVGPLDSYDPAATATAAGYAAAGTAGTQVAVVRQGKIPWAVGRYTYTWDLGRIARAPVLRGTAEKLVLMQSVALTGGVFQWSITFEFTEE